MRIIGRIKFNSLEARTLTEGFFHWRVTETKPEYPQVTDDEKTIIRALANGEQPDLDRIRAGMGLADKIVYAIKSDLEEFRAVVDNLKANPDKQTPKAKAGEVPLIGNYLTCYRMLVEAREQQLERVLDAFEVLKTAERILVATIDESEEGDDDE